MASIRFLLGMIPSTAKIEEEEKALNAEYEKLLSFAESKQLARYNELHELVNSASFIQKKKEIESLNYKTSEEFQKEKEFNTLKKSKDLLLYFSTVGGSALKKFMELDGSEKISRYEALRSEVNGADFKEKMKDKEFGSTPEAKKLNEFKQLDGSQEIKDYYKFKASKELENFKNIDGSQKLARYNELKEYTASKEFTERKAYLLDKKRFEKSEEFKELEEYNKLKKDADILWYFKVKDSNKFDILKHHEVTFSEDFEGDKLDPKKWLTNYYWGDKLLKDRYSIDSDLQYYTEKENFEIRNSFLKIITKPQKITGKAWSPVNGFTTREFSYTSGLVNTGKSFRQKYGIFSAKIKLGDPSAKSAFWLLSDSITPHIDVCRTSNGKVVLDMFAGVNKVAKTALGAKYAGDSYIFTLEWTAGSLVWKVNGIEAFRQTENVPQEPMYISLAGGLNKPISGQTSMEIDWIRVYQLKN
ncbi:MAG: glycoside hydrolase family 16 protein [Bacteroidales bacterium]